MKSQDRLIVELEIALLWEGGISRQALAERCGVSLRTAQSFINEYRQDNDDLVYYCRLNKKYRKGSAFVPKAINEDIQYYLDYCQAKQREQKILCGSDKPSHGRVQIHDIDRETSSEVFEEGAKVLIEAINQRVAIECHYSSRTGVKQHILSPHAIVFARRRYHARCFNHTSEKFGDYVLGRFYRTELLPDISGVSAEQDEEWQSFEDLSFQLNPDLDENHKETLRLEWNLKGQKTTMTRTVRKALSKYVKEELKAPSVGQSIPTWIFKEDESNEI